MWREAFLAACNEGQVQCAEALLAAGCDAAAVDSSGVTGLMIAARRGHAALLPRLLAGGVPPEARDKVNGATAFLHVRLPRWAGGVRGGAAGRGLRRRGRD